jgi:protein-S-isoprenylcysteine O-methyltransferase
MKVNKKVLMPFMIVILPALGDLEALTNVRLWFLLAICVAASFLQPNYNLSSKKTNTEDHGTEVQIIWSVAITQLTAVIEFCYFKRVPSSWEIIDVFAVTAMISGFALRTWAVHTLGQFFTMHITVQDQQKIIQTGPYKIFRHPSYVGAFLLYLGTITFLHSWNSLIAASFLLPIVWIRRIYFEEKMLLESFGDEYKTYCKKAKRLIPWVW